MTEKKNVGQAFLNNLHKLPSDKELVDVGYFMH
jgi:hypothetical protein